MIQQTYQLIVLKCNFSTIEFWQVGDFYACDGEMFLSGDVYRNRNITTMVGFHKLHRSNIDVRGVKFFHVDLNAMPKGIEKFFPNLEALWTELCGFTELSIEDFAPFKKLRQVHFSKHKLQSLKANLFAQNPQMQHVSFSLNPLKHISVKTFSNLKNLESLYLLKSGCVDQQAENSKARVEKLIARLATDCPVPSTQSIDKNFLVVPEISKVDNDISQDMHLLLWKILEMEKKISEIEKRMCN